MYFRQLGMLSEVQHLYLNHTDGNGVALYQVMVLSEWTYTSDVPIEIYNNHYLIYPDQQADRLIKTLCYEVDTHYLPTLGIDLAAGCNFSP